MMAAVNTRFHLKRSMSQSAPSAGKRNVTGSEALARKNDGAESERMMGKSPTGSQINANR